MKISALIPTYNRLPFLTRAIDSVLAQTVPVDEIIVVDDGSSDGTAGSILSRYGSSVRVVTQANMGVSGARKRAVDEASGEWIAFLDSDDEWLPERNAVFQKAIAQVTPHVALIFGETRIVTDEGTMDSVFRQNRWVIDRDLHIFADPLTQLVWDMNCARPCALQSSVIRRSVLTELRCFNEGLRHSEDFLAGMQIATRYQFAAIPSEVTRLHRTSDLTDSSLERTWVDSEDHRKAMVFGCECAAKATGAKAWRSQHATAVRALCKWRAQRSLAIRGLAWDQFKCGVSLRSVLFFGGAMLGHRFFRAAFFFKRNLRALGGAVRSKGFLGSGVAL
jgi:glycosyltransferase involved in cell wall biosynthesis